MADFFEDLSQGQSNAPKKPFFDVNVDNDDELKTWLKEEMSFLRQESQFRYQKIKNNYARYKGIQYRDQLYTPRDLPQKRIRYMPQMVVPLIADVIDEKTARLLEYKPSVVVIPQDDSQQDKADAKIAKRFLSHVDSLEQTDEKFFRLVRSSKIAGESFMFVLWCPDKGDLVGMGQHGSLPDGKQFENPVYQGEISLKNVTAINVLYEKAKNWEDTNYIFEIDWEYTDALKRDYPNVANDIKSTEQTQYYDFAKMEDVSLRGKTMVINFYHRKTRHLKDGFEIKFCGDTILKKGTLSYNDGELPCERLIDVENEDEQHGEAQLEKTRSMVSQYNNINNLIIKQQMLCSHPKWFIDAGSVDEQQLGNDTSIVKMKPGSRQPVLAQGNPVSPQLFEYKDMLKKEFYDMSKSNSVVRGELPAGVTAFVALQFVSESENRRISQDISKVNNCVKRIYKKVLSRAAQYYKPSDKRTLMILGEDNRWTSMDYDPQSLAGKFSIEIQNASSLPESKALRTQFILDMGKQFPDMFPREQLLEMLNLTQSDKFVDEGAAAARAAEAENEMIFDKGGAPEPQPYELLITHWRTHIGAIQDINFKTKGNPESQKAMQDHLLATEYLMFEQAKKSPQFAQLVMQQCPQFPIFLTTEPISEVNPLMGMPMTGPGGQGPGPGPGGGFVPPEKNPQPLPGDPGYSTVRRGSQQGQQE